MKYLWISTIIAGLWLVTAATPAGAATPIAKEPYIGAVSMNGQTGEILWEKNADAQCYPASTLKLMVLYIYLEALDLGAVTIDEQVGVSKEAFEMGGSQVYLDPRETFSVEEMLYALMVQSANDVAVALAEHLAGSVDTFVRLMNEKAEALGMKNTTFYSPHGLILPGTPPDVSTARDLAILSYELLKHPETTRFTSVTTRTFRPGVTEMRNHNPLLWDYPGCDGLKTGYTTAAGYSICATAERNGRRAIAVVVGAKNRIKRNEEAAALMSQAFLKIATNETENEEMEGSAGSVSSGSGPRNQLAPPSGGKATTATATTAAAPPPAQRHSPARAILLSIFSFLLGVIVTATAMKLMAQKNAMFR